MDANQRANSHHDDIKKEQPLFIHPAAEDPSAFLEFDREYVCAINNNSRGKATIEELGLKRDKLLEMRRDRLDVINTLIDYRSEFANRVAMAPKPGLRDQLAKIDARLAQYVSDSAQYAAMVRAVLPTTSGFDAE
jgi:hypothetical protein